jgi:hypothetical protein
MVTGEVKVFKAPMPFLDGQRFEATFAKAPPPVRKPERELLAPGEAMPALSPPSVVSRTGDSSREMRDLVALQELSQGFVEELAEDVSSLRQEVQDLRQAASGGDAERLRGPEKAPIRLYAYLDGEYSGSDDVNDHGSFDLHHAYFGVEGDIAPRWDGRLELELDHGFMASSGGTLGAGLLDRAYLTHHGNAGDTTLGKIFTPFGFWSPIHQAVFKMTTQDPLMYGTAYSVTQTGLTFRRELEDDGSYAVLGIYNGDGVTPDEVDDNDNKSLLLGWETKTFAKGRFGIFFNRQRDGNEAHRVERQWIYSLEQTWKRLNLMTEYFHQRAIPVLGGFGNNNAFYSDLRYSFRDDLSVTYRFDTMRHDPNTGGGGRFRNMLNFNYAVSPSLIVKTDFYHDKFQDPARLSSNGFDIAIASAFGL